MEQPAPLIVTVALDPASQSLFDRLRTRYFPPARNVLDAHVTMFHHLPGERREVVEQRLRAACDAQAPCAFTAPGLRFLGHGTAYELDMPHVAGLRADLVRDWSPWLTAQDRQPWRPHVTVQNKVSTAEARQTLAELQAGFTPVTGTATGLCLWSYLGGPWEELCRLRFGTS